jgi:hypothetical protein
MAVRASLLVIIAMLHALNARIRRLPASTRHALQREHEEHEQSNDSAVHGLVTERGEPEYSRRHANKTN